MPQMGRTYFIKLCFIIGEFWNGITEIKFDLHIYLWITVSVMNWDTKIIVLDCCPSIALTEYSRIIATFSISGRNFTVG
jgi:hypothetical protein